MIKTIIIEDEEIIRKGLMYTIDWQQYGCVIVGDAANGAKGETMIRDLKPELVLIDIRMPFQDGLQTLSNTKPQQDFEAIIMSGYDDFAYAKRAISLGVFEYLLKPVDENILGEVLEKAAAKIQQKRRLTMLENMAAAATDHWPLGSGIIGGMTSAKARLVQQVLDKVSEEYAGELTLGDLSRRLQISESYLGRTFKEVTGHTFGEYLTVFRIKKAAEFLQQPKFRVNEVAEVVGINDSRYFSTVFKKHLGCTPSEFKKGFWYKSAADGNGKNV